MSVESMGKALKCEQVNGAVKLVLIGIANHDGDNGAWPGIKTLCRYAGVKERRVQQCIEELVTRGLITVEVNAGGTADWRPDRRPNRYTLHLDGVHSTAPRDSDGVQSVTERGAIPDTNGVQPTAPKPSIEPSREPSNSLSPAATARRGLTSGMFDIWWQVFRSASDRPGSKGDALKAWGKLSNEQRFDALEGLKRHCGHILAHPGQYVMPNGSTWLNKMRWLDEAPQEPPRREAKSHSGIDYLRTKMEALHGS